MQGCIYERGQSCCCCSLPFLYIRWIRPYRDRNLNRFDWLREQTHTCDITPPHLQRSPPLSTKNSSTPQLTSSCQLPCVANTFSRCLANCPFCICSTRCYFSDCFTEPLTLPVFWIIVLDISCDLVMLGEGLCFDHCLFLTVNFNITPHAHGSPTMLSPVHYKLWTLTLLSNLGQISVQDCSRLHIC